MVGRDKPDPDGSTVAVEKRRRCWSGCLARISLPAMSLHLLKLCVGADSIGDLEDWIEERLTLARRLGRTAEQIHTTRMVPKRVEELLDGGSLYWVIKGQVQARQRLLDVKSFTGADGRVPVEKPANSL